MFNCLYRHPYYNACSLARRTVDLQCSADLLGTLLHAWDAKPTPHSIRGWFESHPIIGYSHFSFGIPKPQPNSNGICMRMLERIVQRFLGNVVKLRLDRA